jgi:hypothetical protein
MSLFSEETFLAKKKDSKKVSKQTLIAEAQRLATQTEELTRDFFRNKSEFKDKWNIYWPTFQAFLAEAQVVSKIAKPSPDKQVELEIEKVKDRKHNLKAKYEAAIHRAERAEETLSVLQDLRTRTSQHLSILPKVVTGTSESVAVWAASDWHIEEKVDYADVEGRNYFDLTTADHRIEMYWQNMMRLTDIMQKDTNIPVVFLALLGDFITNTIHPDVAESNQLGPGDAIWWVQERLVSGMKFALDNLSKKTVLKVACHTGNHGRSTPKLRQKTEPSNSWERLMYREMKMIFDGDTKYGNRIEWCIADGYHSTHDLFGGAFKLRTHHGHAIGYGGGVGGITIPVNKKIANWNINNPRTPNLDLFGHFHQYIDSGTFVTNGSLIGYNAFANSIGAAFEKPTQAFFLINKKFNSKTMATPIFLD